jgi:tetratricopeptide (TPR) repeat protein
MAATCQPLVAWAGKGHFSSLQNKAYVVNFQAVMQQGKKSAPFNPISMVTSVQLKAKPRFSILGNSPEKAVPKNVIRNLACKREVTERLPSQREWYSIGCGEILKNKPALAVLALKQAVRLDDDDSSALLNLATAYSMLGEYGKAIACNRLIIGCQKDSAAHYNLGLIYFRLRQFPRAAFHFSKSHEYGFNNYDALYNLGVVFLEMGKLTNAAYAFERLIERRPTDEKAWQGLGLSLKRLKALFAKDKQKAAALIRQSPTISAIVLGNASKRKPNDTKTAAMLSTAMDEVGRRADANPDFRGMLIDAGISLSPRSSTRNKLF